MKLVRMSCIQWIRRLLTVLAAGGLIAIGSEARSIYFGANWHEVIPGRVYRCAQPSPQDLQRQLDRFGICTVVNLRGTCLGFDWYEAECRATSGQGVSQEDVTLSATRLPAPDELRRYIEVLEQTDYPILLHCRQGVDRTGVMSAVALLLLTDAPYDQARRQLSLRFGHVAIGPTAIMSRFFELYEEWLRTQRVAHSRKAFRRWACREYCPDVCRGTLRLLGSVARVAAGEPLSLPVRATNTSLFNWRLAPGTETGVHVRFMVFASDGRLIQIGRAGQFERSVVPGESLDLLLAVAPIHEPGRYHLLADLHDRNLWAFSQLGSDPIELDIEVHAP